MKSLLRRPFQLKGLTWLQHWLLTCLLLTASIAFGQSPAGLPPLFFYQPGDPATDLQVGVRVSMNTDLARSVPGAATQFRTASGSIYVFITDTLTTSKTGTNHWVAHLQGSGAQYRAIISYGNGVAFGNISTPDGDFRLDTSGGQMRLLDLKTSTRRPQIFDEMLIPPVTPHAAVKSQASAQPPAQAGPASGPVTIDLMVLYTNGLAARIGPDAMSTRIEHLVALANQAYIDSQVNIQLRLVYSTQVNYSDQVTHQAALAAMQSGAAPFASVASLRNAYGADLVALLNQLDSSADPGMCGIAYTLGSAGSPMNADFAYSVISVGDDIQGTNLYCSEYGLAHETGHNLGNAHDRAHSVSPPGSYPGAFPYSYGYGISGKFGSIMSYISPIVGMFSNPATVCDGAGDACGVSENDPVNSANNALSLNNTAATVAAFRPPTTLDTTPDNFNFTTLSGVNVGELLLSETILVSGLSTTVPISISAGQYSINGGAFTSASGMVSNGQTVQVRLAASSAPYDGTTAMLTIGTLTRAFRLITGPTSATTLPAVVAAYQHSMALRSDGSVWSWGDNTHGQLGDGTQISENAPVAVVNLGSVIAMAGGDYHSLALKSDGSVWGWGDSTYGQLGSTASTTNPLPIRVTGLSNISKIAASDWDALAIDANRAVWYWGNNTFTPMKVGGISTAIAVAPGWGHRLVLLSDGTVRAWGDNSSGQLGIGASGAKSTPTLIASLSNVTAVSAGERHSLALRADGTVWAWGDNTYGQLGDGSLSQRNAPVAVTAVGGVGQLGNVVAIYAGRNHSLAVKSDGSLVAWGRNLSGQLGDGTTQDRLSPVALSLSNISAVSAFTNHSMALLRDGSVMAWGYNGQGELGDTTAVTRTTPVPVGRPGWWFGGGDMEPTALSFGSSSGPAGSTVTSATMTLGAINQATPVSIQGGQYSINGGAFTASNSSVALGQTITLRVTAAPGVGSVTTAKLTVGGVLASFSVTTTGQLAQTIVFGGAPALLVSGSGTLSANGGASGNPIVFSSNTPTVCSVAGSIVTGVSVGNCVVAADQAGNANYLAATQVTQTIGVGQGTQTISFGAAPAMAVGGSATLTASGGASGNPLVFSSTTPAICTITGSNVAAQGTGACMVAADQAGNVNYQAAPQATQTITVDNASVSLVKGWNLLGNGMSQVLMVADAFGNPALVSSVWKWNVAPPGWQFYTPTMDAATLQAYATSKGYTVLTSINPADGFWVNAVQAFAATLPAGTALNGQAFQTGQPHALQPTWNLVGIGNALTPSGFNLALSLQPPPSGTVPINLTTLWAWDSLLLQWYFYSPSLEAQGGTALTDYISSKNYLDFTANNKTLNMGTGFWVNRP